MTDTLRAGVCWCSEPPLQGAGLARGAGAASVALADGEGRCVRGGARAVVLVV